MSADLNLRGIWNRSLASLRKAATRNLLLKLVSLLLAFILWFGVTGGPRREVVIPVRLDLASYIPDGWALAADYIKSIEVRISARDNMIQRLNNSEEAKSEVKFSFDRNAIRPQREIQRLTILPSNVLVRSGYDVVNVNPSEILLQLDRKKTAMKPVRIEIDGELPEGYLLFENPPRVLPSSVTVEGGETMVNQLPAVVARLDLSELVVTEPVSLSIPLALNRNPMLRYSAAEVEVTLDIVEVSESRRFNIRTFEFSGYDESSERVASFAPTMVTWEITGPKSWIGGLSAEEISMFIDLGAVDRTQRIELPIVQEMLKFEEEPARLDLIRATLISQTKTLSVRIGQID
jgi:YbbR domain-containing protein